MNAFLTSLAAFTLAVSTVSAAAPGLKEVLSIPNELSFTGSFAKILLDVPAADFPAFRAQLHKQLEGKELPARHAAKAMEMADNRWLEIDIPGFLIACKDKEARISHAAKIRATTLLCRSDPQAAIRAFQDFGFHQTMGESAAQFFAALAAKDPQLALKTYLELDKQQKLRGGTAIIIRAWADVDPAAAWQAISTLPKVTAEPNVTPSHPGDTHNLRALVCAAAARTDEALATRLLESIDNNKDLNRIRLFLIAELAKSDPDLALAWTRKFNTPETLQTFSSHVRWGTAEETLKKLIELTPKDQLRDHLLAFFTEHTDFLLPKYRHARLIPQVPDPKLRREIILAIVADAYGAESRSNNRTALPAPVVDAIIAESTGLQTTTMPLPQRILMIRAIMAKDAGLGLSWMLALSDEDWGSSRYDLARMWPLSSLPTHVPQLIAAESPRETALAELLAERWWKGQPVAAFPHIKEKYPQLILRRFDPELFLKDCGGDLAKARELLATVPDPAARTDAMNQLALTTVKEGQPAEILAIVLERIKDPTIVSKQDECDPVTYHPSPEMDAIISAIPEPRQADREYLLGLRAAHLFKQGEEARAYTLWRQIKEDELLLASVTSGARSGIDPTKIKDWENLVATVAMRPKSEVRTDLLNDLGQTMARYAPLAGVAAAEKTNDPEARALILIAIANTVKNPKTLEAGLAVLRTVPENKETLPVHTAWREVIARLDPAQGWKIAIERGLETDDGRRIGIGAMEQLAIKDAKAALALLLDAGSAGLRHEFLTPVARGLIATDPAAAFRTALAMPPQVRFSLLQPALAAWVKIDPPAACAASLEISSNPELFRTCLRDWLRIDETLAIAWVSDLKNAEARDQALRAIIPAIADKNPVKASKLFTENPSVHNDAQTCIAIANSLATSDYAAACQFLLENGNAAEIRAIAAAIKRHLLTWFSADTTAAADFVKSLKPSPLVDFLLQEIRDDLLPRYSAALDGWNPPDIRKSPQNAIPANDLSGIKDAFLYPESSPIPAILDRLNAALLKNDLRLALQAAVELPDSRYDHFTISILNAFPTTADAEAAIQTIPDPASRERALAWLKQK